MTDTLATFEAHILPNGDAIYYRDKDHGYFREIIHQKNHEIVGRGKLTAVSTVVKPFDFYPDNLMNWAALLERKGIAALAQMDVEDEGWVGTWVQDAEAIGMALDQAGMTWKQQRNAAATRGTNVHLHALHALSRGEPTPAYGQMTSEEAGYAKGVVQWWLDHEPTPLHAEAVVADLNLGVAGRFDLMADIAGRITIVDAKTSGYLKPAMGAQLAGYAALADASGYPPVDDLIVLQVMPDGGYRSVLIEAEEDDFYAAVDLYRRSLKLGNQLSRATRG